MIEKLWSEYKKAVYEESIRTAVYRKNNMNLKTFMDLENFIHMNFNNDGYAVVYLYNKILIARKQNNKLLLYDNETFDLKYLLKLRVFNEQTELLIWKGNESMFNMRLRIDDDIEGASEKTVINTRQIIWGTRLTRLKNGWSELSERRGTRLIVPFENLVIDNEKNRLELWVRNYVEFNQYGQAGYSDCRFVKFANRGESIEIVS